MLIVGVMVGLIVYDSEEKKLVPTFINALAVINCDETHRLPSWTKCRVQSRTDSLLVRNTRKISRHIPLKSCYAYINCFETYRQSSWIDSWRMLGHLQLDLLSG